MANRQRKGQKKGIPDDMQRLLRMLAIPAVVLVLILVIIVADRVFSGREETAESETSQDTAAETLAVDTGAAVAAVDETDGSLDGRMGDGETDGSSGSAADSDGETVYAVLDKEAVPEIHTLMEEYCRARASSDAETLYRLYGRTDTDGIEQERARMQYNARYIDSFRNIICYTRQGLNEDSWLVYTSADIKFRAAETLAPTVMWCYVTRNEEGTCIIVDPDTLGDDVKALIEETNMTDDVRSLARRANLGLQEAVAADPDLATIYGTLNAGSPLWQQSEESTEAEVVLIDGVETEPESAAGAVAGDTATGNTGNGDTATGNTDAGNTGAETEISVETGGESAGEQSE